MQDTTLDPNQQNPCGRFATLFFTVNLMAKNPVQTEIPLNQGGHSTPESHHLWKQSDDRVHNSAKVEQPCYRLEPGVKLLKD